jgi:gamma-glutamyltranspeptidase/glutathione hydrolase
MNSSSSSTPEFAFAAVAAPHPAAAAAGQAILAQGGDALEAAIAMAAALAVVCPHRTGLGGDGLWLIREPRGKVRCLEAFGAAGSRATIRRYFDNGHETRIPARGALAALTAPGAVAGWAQALEFSRARGSRLPLADLLRDAIRMARDGAPVSAGEARSAPGGDLRETPGFAGAFLAGGEAPKAGDARRQEKLAETLAHLAHAGLMDFYRGDIAREMADDLARIGAPVTRDDLKAQGARWRDPYSVRLRDAVAFNAPPPSQGLAALMILGQLERLDAARPDSFEHAHGLVEASKRAFAVRNSECADFQWPTSDPERWLAADGLERQAQAISMSRAAPFAAGARIDDGVWIGAVDASGLAVSCAHSLSMEWGSGCVLPSVGVLMNNRGAMFSLDEKSAQALHPGRRPLNMLNASIVAFDDGAVALSGATGGDVDPQVAAQVIARVRAGMAPDAAIDAPRLALVQGEDGPTLRLEDRFDASLLRALARAGHEVERSGEYDGAFGHAGLLVRSKTGRIRGAHDPRAEGAVAGL